MKRRGFFAVLVGGLLAKLFQPKAFAVPNPQYCSSVDFAYKPYDQTGAMFWTRTARGVVPISSYYGKWEWNEGDTIRKKLSDTAAPEP